MAQNNDDSKSSNRFSLSSIVPTQYVVMGSVVLIGLFNVYRGLFRFSFGFIAGIGVGVAIGFALADTSLGQYILQRRSRSQQTRY